MEWNIIELQCSLDKTWMLGLAQRCGMDFQSTYLMQDDIIPHAQGFAAVI